AGRAGIRNGDVLAYIDGIPVDSLDREEVSKRLRGSIGSDVTLSLQPKEAGGVSQVTLRRTLVVPPTVTTKVEDGVATFKVSGFNQRTATSLTDSLRQVQGKMGDGLKGVVLDLRGNPGGLLDQAVGVADLFMPSGRIVWTKGRHPLASQSYDAKPGDIGEKVPLVVLIDGKSASASEIVAAALQDSGRAVVVGTNSYGKGTVQTVIRMPNDGEMTLTWSRFHSPSGYALHGLGVLPTLCTANEQVPETALIADVREGTSKVGLQLAAWRTSDINRVEERKQLRTSCPSAKHAENLMDSDLGRRLLVDQGLYNRALSLNEITMAAHASLH
ncbi:MAG: S41 family peptidase, partial [Rhodospirillales bacterium]|nr:S41 family peptidase [Rhodospirillales bacterium]